MPLITASATQAAAIATEATVTRATPVTRVTYRPAATLPATGARTGTLVMWAFLLLLFGGLLVTLPRVATVALSATKRRRNR